MPFDVVPVARLLYSPSAILWWIINSAPSGPQAGSWRPYVKPAIVPAALHVSWQFLCCGYPGCSQNIKRSFSLRLCKFEVDAWYLYFEQLPKCVFTEIKDVVVTLLDSAHCTAHTSVKYIKQWPSSNARQRNCHGAGHTPTGDVTSCHCGVVTVT